MRLTIVHPCVGRRAGDRGYIRTWQMEPLPAAVIAGLTPRDVEIRFYDDRLEAIPYDEPTDLVAISVETYTALRSYQIASEFRRRRVPVVMGGFHPSLEPEETAQYAESVVVGEAEQIWEQVIGDGRRRRLEKFYRSGSRPGLAGLRPDRRIFNGKRYLPIGLVEAGRGCRFKCDFCAIQTVLGQTQTRRPVEDVVAEVASIRGQHRMIFFVDDNVISSLEPAKELLRALTPLRVRWVGQCSINAAHDEEFLRLLAASGCKALLIGFESLDPRNLKDMSKGFNLMRGGFEPALANLRRHGIRVYGTFIFGYDHDTPESFDASVHFAQDQAMYIAAFNHLTPFPGTPLYKRLEAENRLTFDRWWLDKRYRYNMVPFRPRSMSAEELRDGCLRARREFYGWASIFRRGSRRVNWSDPFMLRNFAPINLMHRAEIDARDGLPLGDESFEGDLVRAC